MNLIEGILNRRSVRAFKLDAIEDSTRIKIQKYISELNVPFEHNVTLEMFKTEPTRKLYTMFQAPEDNLAIFSETDFVSLSKAGFIGELAVLYATTLDVSTCWFGHYHLKTMNQLIPHMTIEKTDPKWSFGKGEVKGRRVICITPIAYRKDKGLRLIDRIQASTMSFKRKPLEKLLTGKTDLSQRTKDILEWARLAPSAGNGQFWRFHVSENEKIIKVQMPVGYTHPKWEHPNVDIGIAASHIYLGLKDKNIDFTINIKEESGCAVWYFELTS